MRLLKRCTFAVYNIRRSESPEFDLFSIFFFFKQKTAYEISSRDWSSDVCSSDLATSSERPEPPPGKKTFLVSSFSNLEGIGMAMGKAAQELGTPVRIYFYTISTLFLHNSTQAIAKFFQIVTSRAKTNLGFILYAVQEGVHEPLTMNLLRSLVDGVVEMRFSETMQSELRIHHMRGYRVDASWHPFIQLPEKVVAL